MLSSIHPLGERGRHNRWWLTVGAFLLGAVAGGVILAGAAALVGRWLLPAPAPVVLVAAVMALAGVADLLRIAVPGPHRQVNEHWIGAYRGWVYGGAFGFQLGLGFSTYVVTWGTPGLVLASALLADPVAGVSLGLGFGLGRTLPLLAAAWIDRPSRLAGFHRAMARIGAPAHVAVAVAMLAAGALLGVVRA